MLEQKFTKIANKVAHITGLPLTFAVCVSVVVVWAVSGPVFHFSDTWQLIINTGTTIVTFLMVFLIQNTQNRDGAAIQAKLDELVRVSTGHNHFIGIEHLTESEVEEIRTKCEQAATRHDKELAKIAATKAIARKRVSKKKTA
ncbi:low affinity iron permease family protein [Mesorhizobium sp. A623]